MGKYTEYGYRSACLAALCALAAACAGQTPAAEGAEATPPAAADDEPSASESAAAPASGEKPCRADRFEFAEVEAACKDGGVKAAKGLMKDLVKKGKEAGQSLKCSSCHDNTKDYTLADNAVDDLRALLEL